MENAVAEGKTIIKAAGLPASFRTKKHSLVLPNNELQDFLESDLSVKRIESIWSYLWLVGRPYLPRPLNIQAVLNRTIIPTTDASLHLVWTSGKIFIKPLPAYIVSEDFYDRCLASPSLPVYDRCLGSRNPHGDALGLLYSYLALVPTELDFALAQGDEAHLFPRNYEWDKWQTLTNRVLTDYPENTIYQYMPLRYVYGELRLSRLDKIYRYLRGDWLHGYSRLTGSTSYSEFFLEYIGIVTSVTVYIAIVLTAMAVGLVTEGLKDNPAFIGACYG